MGDLENKFSARFLHRLVAQPRPQTTQRCVPRQTRLLDNEALPMLPSATKQNLRQSIVNDARMVLPSTRHSASGAAAMYRALICHWNA